MTKSEILTEYKKEYDLRCARINKKLVDGIDYKFCVIERVRGTDAQKPARAALPLECKFACADGLRSCGLDGSSTIWYYT